MAATSLMPTLVEFIRDKRISWADLGAACEAVPVVQWQRLPLVTGATFGDKALMDSLRVRVSKSFEDYIGAYEEFIGGCIETNLFRRAGIRSWLETTLGLKKADLTHVFGFGTDRRGRRARYRDQDVFYHAIGFAALAAMSFPGAKVDMGSDEFMVSVEGCKLGVSEGRVWINLGGGRFTRRLVNASHEGGIVHWRRDEVLKEEKSYTSIYTRLKAWALHFPERVGEQAEGFNLTLAILRWKESRTPGQALDEAFLAPVDHGVLQRVRKFASEIELSRNPYGDMRNLLVPAVISYHRFRQEFGAPPSSMRAVRERTPGWRALLENITQTL